MPIRSRNQKPASKLYVYLFFLFGLLSFFSKNTASYAANKNILGFPFPDRQTWYVFQGYNSLHQGQFLYAFDLVKDDRWDALNTTGGASIVAAASGRVYGSPYQINGPNGIDWGKGFKMILDDGMILEYDHLMNLPSYLVNNAVITKGTEVGKVFNGKPGGVNHLHFQTVPTEPLNFGLWHYPSNGPSDGNGTWSGTKIVASFELLNPSFENGNDPTPWVTMGPCNYVAYNNIAIAQHGSRYLAANRNTDPNCSSIYQDVPYAPELGESYRFAIWVRSATGAARNGTLALWALGGQNANAVSPFSISSQQWQCIETSLPIQRSDHTVLRAQIYLDSMDGGDFLFDNATLKLGNERICPLSTSQLLDNPSFEYGSTPISWQILGPCNYVAYANNTSIAAQHGSRYLAANRNIDPNCSSVYQDVPYAPKLGENYRFAIWVRSATGAARNGTLALWALGGQNTNAAFPFSISSQQWQCIETSLPIQRSDHAVLRAQIYLDSMDGGDFLFDNATLRLDTAPICPRYSVWLPILRR